MDIRYDYDDAKHEVQVGTLKREFVNPNVGPNKEPLCNCLNSTLPMIKRVVGKPGSNWYGKEIYSCAMNGACDVSPLLVTWWNPDKLSKKDINTNPKCATCETPLTQTEIEKYKKRLLTVMDANRDAVEIQAKISRRLMEIMNKNSGYICIDCQNQQ